jgi:hypothetical protein
MEIVEMDLGGFFIEKRCVAALFNKKTSKIHLRNFHANLRWISERREYLGIEATE